MPTYEWQEQFRRDLRSLDGNQQELFRAAVRDFVADLRTGTFRPGLRVKPMKRAPGIWEMTWDFDGRATFEYGSAKRLGEPHVVWRRIGTHAIFLNP